MQSESSPSEQKCGNQFANWLIMRALPAHLRTEVSILAILGNTKTNWIWTQNRYKSVKVMSLTTLRKKEILTRVMHILWCVGGGEVARDETRLKLLFNRPRGVTDSILDSESSESGSNPRETFWGCRSADCEVMQVSAAREPRIEPGSKKACVTATAQLVP